MTLLCTCVHTHTHAHAHTRTRTNTHTHTHTHTHKHTHTHTHTHTHVRVRVRVRKIEHHIYYIIATPTQGLTIAALFVRLDTHTHTQTRVEWDGRICMHTPYMTVYMELYLLLNLLCVYSLNMYIYMVWPSLSMWVGQSHTATVFLCKAITRISRVRSNTMFRALFCVQ